MLKSICVPLKVSFGIPKPAWRLSYCENTKPIRRKSTARPRVGPPSQLANRSGMRIAHVDVKNQCVPLRLPLGFQSQHCDFPTPTIQNLPGEVARRVRARTRAGSPSQLANRQRTRSAHVGVKVQLLSLRFPLGFQSQRGDFPIPTMRESAMHCATPACHCAN